MTESNERGARSAERGAETEKTGGGRGRESGTGVRPPPSPSSLESYATVLREALSHALGAAHLRPPKAGSDLHLALWHLAKAEREAKIESAAPLPVAKCGTRVVARPGFGKVREYTKLGQSLDAPEVAADGAPGSGFRVPSSPACDVTVEVPPGGQITCGPLRIKRRDFGSDVVIELRGEVRVDAVLASPTVRIRTDGRWYPEVQASEADLPLVLIGQGDTQCEIRPEDV